MATSEKGLIAALKAENLKFQRQIDKLEAKIITLNNKIKTLEERLPFIIETVNYHKPNTSKKK
jgi:peptidoglycan hydrolase CwlO-like protein